MSIKKYAFIVENEVFYIASINSFMFRTTGMSKHWEVGFSSLYRVLEVLDLDGFKIGSMWNGESFTETSSTAEYIQPKLTSTAYAFLSLPDNISFGVFMPQGEPLQKTFRAAYETGISVVDVSEYAEIEAGWKRDGTGFTSPL